MRQIEKERLRPMNCFIKAADEFAHHNFLIKLWLKPKAPAYPDEKNRERGNPRPPTEPGATRLRFRRARRSRPTTALPPYAPLAARNNMIASARAATSDGNRHAVSQERVTTKSAAEIQPTNGGFVATRSCGVC